MDSADGISAASSSEGVALWNRLWALECSYWADIDFNDARHAPEYYTEDAVFDAGLPGARFEGREAINGFFAGRREADPGTVLHIVNNFALVQWSATAARTRSVISLYEHEGKPPQASASPRVIAAVENSYVATEGDVWKISTRVFTLHFIEEQLLPLVTAHCPVDEQA